MASQFFFMHVQSQNACVRSGLMSQLIEHGSSTVGVAAAGAPPVLRAELLRLPLPRQPCGGTIWS